MHSQPIKKYVLRREVGNKRLRHTFSHHWSLSIARTQARLSFVNVRSVSVRPCLKTRVRTVSYVAVNSRRVWYQASCRAICM